MSLFATQASKARVGVPATVGLQIFLKEIGILIGGARKKGLYLPSVLGTINQQMTQTDTKQQRKGNKFSSLSLLLIPSPPHPPTFSDIGHPFPPKV
jgi:hypothetical protein